MWGLWENQHREAETLLNVVTDFRWTVKESSLYGENSFQLLPSLYIKEVHLRRVCVFVKGDDWPHTSLLALVGPGGKTVIMQYVIWCSVRVSCLLISIVTLTWKISSWILMHCFLLINMTDIMRLRLTYCSAKVPAAIFFSDWHVSQHPERGLSPNSSNNIPSHSSLLSSDSCICFIHLWWTGRLVKRGMSALIYSLPGTHSER